MLDNWFQAALDEAGLGDVHPSLKSEQVVTAILDLARHAAHNVERPAAPLTTFVLGLAVGRDGDADQLADLAARLGSRARAWNDED